MKIDDLALSNLAKPLANCQLISCSDHEWQILGPHVGDIGDADDYCPFCLADEIERLSAEGKDFALLKKAVKQYLDDQTPGNLIVLTNISMAVSGRESP